MNDTLIAAKEKAGKAGASMRHLIAEKRIIPIPASVDRATARLHNIGSKVFGQVRTQMTKPLFNKKAILSEIKVEAFLQKLATLDQIKGLLNE